MNYARQMYAPCKWDVRFLLTGMEGVVEFSIGPPIVHHVDAVLDASGVGLEVWQGRLPLVVEHGQIEQHKQDIR